MPKLGVNIDHVATLRQARGQKDPDPVWAASVCEKVGCDSIVAHLREDRRHINDADVKALTKRANIRFNLEMSINRDIVEVAKRLVPHQATLVPERREELTTEGGMSIAKHAKKIAGVVDGLKRKGIEVSVFIDPDKREIYAAKNIGVDIIEIHTGRYSLATTKASREREFKKIKDTTKYALSLGIVVNAGHGLNYDNTKKIARIKGMNELNIGHSIISRAVFTGLYKAVKDMKELVDLR
ncbi:pyridoxine 5'-phosphate synthase [Candidatus Omnitrophota bacterium]